MRTPIVAGNWKMHTTIAEAMGLAEKIVAGLDGQAEVEVVVCPPFVSLEPVSKMLIGTAIKLGAQNMHDQTQGAFTGEISPNMLAGICDYVLIGHSERRAYFHEGDKFINRKVMAALSAELKPILAVGESLQERDAGRTEEVVTQQVQRGLAEIAKSDTLVVAYEPVWAIGTGRAASADDAQETIRLIRTVLERQYGETFAEQVRILYGGSVNPSNIAEIIVKPDIDGALVGGASLNSEDFVSLVHKAGNK